MIKPKIIVIGSSNTDMICKVPQIPRPGETIMGTEFFTVQGGKGANQAVAAARAGGDVTFIACVGNDAFGHQAIESYKNEGINISCIQKIEGVATGVALINVADSGENSISVAPGANARLSCEMIDAYQKDILAADLVLLQLEIPIETVYHVIRLVHAAKIPVVLNPAPSCRIDPEILAMLTLITPNEHEALMISGMSAETISISAMAIEMEKNGIKSVIITTGSKGALYRQNGVEGVIPAMAVQAVDTTAAGDTFNGYLAVALSKGKNIRDAIQIANKAAAISVTRLGAQPSIPFAEELILTD